MIKKYRHYGLVTRYVNRDLGYQWMYVMSPVWRPAITWTKDILLSNRAHRNNSWKRNMLSKIRWKGSCLMLAITMLMGTLLRRTTMTIYLFYCMQLTYRSLQDNGKTLQTIVSMVYSWRKTIELGEIGVEYHSASPYFSINLEYPLLVYT